MTRPENVCAVVVTYNRKEMLVGFLDAVLRQTHPVERILVIDNASTDGTGESLAEGGYLGNAFIEYVALSENGGGAGGFYEGFKRALAGKPDWIWAMDDDGLPHPDAVKHLLEAPAAAGQFRSPLVLSREQMEDPQNDCLAFFGAVEVGKKPVAVRTLADLKANSRDGLVKGYGWPFNGVLIHREAAERIGLPNPNFFIWGDEWDYYLRARKLGIHVTTVLRALYWHPMDRTLRIRIRVAGMNYEVPYGADRFRNYLLIRNYAYLAIRYRGFVPWVRHTFKYLLFHRTERGCFRSWQVLRFSLAGLVGPLRRARKI